MTTSAKKKFYSDATTKPKIAPPNPDGIPAELRAVRRWVPWALVWKDDGKGGGAWTKVPLSFRNGNAADCNNSRNWGTLRQCLNLVEAGKADGVGFAFAGGGYVGIDLDDHRDPTTGRLTEFAQLVLVTFPTYCEVSASATGAKLIGRGAFPPGTPKKVKELGIELFDSGFFALTGLAVDGTPGEVADLQPAIDAHLAELLGGNDRTQPHTSKRREKRTGDESAAKGTDEAQRDTPKGVREDRREPDGGASADRVGKVPTEDEVEKRVRSHPEGERLMNGVTGDHDDDYSAADLALCNLITFYAQGRADLIDAVFRRSKLLRGKWDEKHARDGRTYGQMTVMKAIDGKREFFDWDSTIKVEVKSKTSPGAELPPPDDSLPWPTMGEAAFHGIAGEFVRLIEPHTEADPVALLVQFLTMFGSAAGRHAFVRVERSKHYMNEFTVLVGRSAKGRKGTSEAWPTDLMAAADPGWVKDCRAGKLASGEALVWALRDPIFRSEDGEVKCVDEGVADKRLLLVESEFSAILKIAAKEQNTLSDQLRDAWDAKDLHNKCKGSPCKATAPHLSAIAHTTDSDLRMFLSENAMANGFGNRFMYFAVRRSKSLPFGGKVDEDALADVAKRVAARLAYARAVGEVIWDAAAAALWGDGGEYDRLSRERYGLAGSLTSRAEAHALRLAMTYALLDGVSEIGRPHLDAALAVWAYAEQTAYRLFGGLTGDPLADDLLRVLRRHTNGVGRWELHQECGKNIPAARIGQALETLRAAGRARSEKRKTGGRDIEVWFAEAM